MKTAFYAAAIVALLHGAEAVSLREFEDSDSADYLAQSLTAGEGNANVDIDEAVKAATLKLTAGECRQEQKVPFETAMLGALNELGNKSSQLAKALETQFAKQRELQKGTEMTVQGKLRVVPLADATEVAVREEPSCECTAPTISIETTK